MARDWEIENDVELRSERDPTAPIKSAVNISSQDAYDLARIGKKEVLKRRFGLTSTVGFACSLMLTWEAVIMNIALGLTNGGPAGLVYGYIGVWIGMISVFVSMGELASMMPSAGGQYHWVSILAPNSSKQFLSHVTGSICIIAWTAAPTAAIYLAASVLQSTIAMNIPSYQPEGWQVTLMMWAVFALCTILNTWLGIILPVIEVLILLVHVLGFFAVLIPLVYLGPKASAASVFKTSFDYGGWNDLTLATFVGLKGTVAAFVGTDGAVHMAEEVANSTRVVPRSMLSAIIINGVMGFAILIAFLFTAGDLVSIIESNASYPFMYILASSTQSMGAAVVLSSMMAALQACAGLAGISSASRMIWAFARDQAIPGWKWVRQVNQRTLVPFRSTCIVVITGSLLSLINIGSSVVLNIILSLVLEAFFASYLISLSLLFYRRLRGDISESGSETPFTWGPFRLNGWVGTVNNAFAIAFSIIMMFFGCWPPENHPAPEKVNYSIAIFVGVTLLSILYYVAYARKSYRGPTIEI
ncbi:choline transport protein [Aspergillus sclerotioniger CBS 115572]|uniref:Choline transport protein n=1 Tax=Aspergillus sclerotioniger CBS 115572 TaxID=1450535 RepID=A0A317WN99_9EURO|nr:choline transport protein [Aspergillus sclerotioniger CBS 115572]PWY87966.1 choline transport protein [Aspergillus sclerotioniger CBS 115572]